MSGCEKRVVVSGLGVVSSLGIGWREFWKNLMRGKSGIRRISSFQTDQYERHYAGEISNFDPTEFISPRKIKMIGRTSQMTIAASQLALADATVLLKDLPKEKLGICIGTTMGEPQVLEKVSQGEMSSQTVMAYPASSLGSNTANYFKITQENLIFSNACAAGNYALGYSYDLIRRGVTDYMLTGGADAFSRVAFTGFSRLLAIAPERCQPFDKNRKGMIPGEAAGMLFLESLKSAQKRKAPVYAEILGYGMSCDAKHMTAPDFNGVAKSVTRALKNAQVSSDAVNYISAHGTGTVENDKAECKAFQKVFHNRLKGIPVSSIKSMLGHTMGAASALESIACCLAIKNSEVPPTINYEERDPDCDIDCVPNLGRASQVDVALNNSQAFGGNNACLIFSSCNPI